MSELQNLYNLDAFKNQKPPEIDQSIEISTVFQKREHFKLIGKYEIRGEVTPGGSGPIAQAVKRF